MADGTLPQAAPLNSAIGVDRTDPSITATLLAIDNPRLTQPVISAQPRSLPPSFMSDTTIDKPIRLNIWQQNLNKSAKAHWDLINSSIHKDWDVILLQEPYLDSYGNTKATNNWRVVYPSSRFTNDSVVRSVILVNSRLDTNHWHQINYNDNNDTTVIQFRGPYGRVSIFNLYIDGNHSDSLTSLDNFTTTNKAAVHHDEHDYMLWCGDFNRHHPLWDEERNGHLFTAAALEESHKLIEIVADHDMVMTLPKDLPTLQAMATGNWTRPDNVFASSNTEQFIVRCDTDPRLRGPGTDHVPILTVIDLPLERKVSPPSPNFRMTDWKDFNEELVARLVDIPLPTALLTEEDFQIAVTNLTSTLQDVIRTTVPITKPCPYSKRWWNKELSDLKKIKNKLSSVSYKYRGLSDHPSHEQHKAVRNQYGDAIAKAKLQHWKDFLEEAEERELWIANKYISNPAGDGGKTRVPSLKVNMPDGTTSVVTSNEGKAELLMKQFFPPQPTFSTVPLNHIYPPQVPMSGIITPVQISRIVAGLSPYKAHGPDEIPNVVLMKCIDTLMDYLVPIFTAVFELNTYSPSWKESFTAVLRKPGKPAYDIPKAYRPVVLLNTIAKILTALVTEDLSYLCELHNLLPATHFGGRPGRSTSDSMHLLTHKIKHAWRQGKVVSVLFLDIEGAFPNADIDRLLHNMRQRRVPEQYVLFAERMIRDRKTRLKFDDYISDSFDILTGIGQGDPLSMLLYLFYNADLLDIPDCREEAALGYVDDTMLYAEGSNFDDTNAMLTDMMTRPNGGYQWAADHHSKFETTKFALVGFTQRRQNKDTGRGTIPIPRPGIMLDGVHINPSTSTKFLGVTFDQELRWTEQAKSALAKATKWTLMYRRLASQSSGINSKFMRRLYLAVAVPKLTYAADIWYTPIHLEEGHTRRSGSIGITNQLGRVQRMGTLAITGALRSTATDTADLHANILPIDLLLNKVCHRAALRMAALPFNHPLHKPLRTCAKRFIKRHRSPMHLLMHIFNIVPDDIETIIVTRRHPRIGNCFTVRVAENRDDSIALMNADQSDIRIFADGSGLDGQAGAAAALYRGTQPPKVLRYHIGPLTKHTTPDSEAIGVILAMHLLQDEQNFTSASISIDNQSVISATAIRKPRAGQHLILGFMEMADELLRRAGPDPRLELRWISGHSGVEGNELVDAEAKKASKGDSSEPHRLPPLLTNYVVGQSIAALKQEHLRRLKDSWRARWGASPRYGRISKIDSSFPFSKFQKASSTLTRAQSSIIVQLRTGHIGLNKHLARINRSDTPLCPSCKLAVESVHHFLFDCPAYRNERHTLNQALGRKASSLKFLLSDKTGVQEVLKYIGRTGRLRRNFGDVTPSIHAS